MSLSVSGRRRQHEPTGPLPRLLRVLLRRCREPTLPWDQALHQGRAVHVGREVTSATESRLSTGRREVSRLWGVPGLRLWELNGTAAMPGGGHQAEGEDMSSLMLQDGRTLTFDDVGDSAGYPVVWHHGSMTCRMLRHPDDSRAAAAGLRIVAVDRPGHGGSSPQKGRTLHGWADDVEQLADHLGLDRFAVAGASAGGPNALAVARWLGDRVSHGVLASSLGPLDDPGALADLDRMMALPFRFLRVPWLIRLPLASTARLARTNPAKWVDQWQRSSSPADRDVFADPAFRAMLEHQTPEAWRLGLQGLIDDLTAIHAWGFPPDDITQHIDVFHGDGDTTVSLAMGTRLAARLPNSDLHVIPDQGHLLFLASWDSIIEALASRVSTT